MIRVESVSLLKKIESTKREYNQVIHGKRMLKHSRHLPAQS